MRGALRLSLVLLMLTLAVGADSLKIGGRERSYLLFTPPDAGGKMPLVLVLHDQDSSPVLMARLTKLHELGAREKFMVAYPEAVGKRWIDGRVKFSREQQIGLQDDVDFLAGLVRDLSKAKPVDTSRVYLVGYGTGASMALRAARERPDLFAGVGAVGGSLAENVDGQLSRPVALMMVYGTVDPLVPDAGGPIQAGVELGRVLSAEATARRFAGNGSPGAHDTSRQGLDITRWQGGAEVVQARVVDWAHEWPSEIDVSALLWEFLARQRR